MVTTMNAPSLKEKVAEERRLEHERAQLHLQWHRKSAAIAEQNGTVARPLVEIEETMAATEAHLKKHSAYSSVSLAQKPKSFRMRPSSQPGTGVNVGASLNTRADEEETQPRLKSSSEQENSRGKGQGNEDEEVEEEEEEEEVERSPAAFSSGPSHWFAPPSYPSRTVRMKSVRMSSPQGRTATMTRDKFGHSPAELDESDSSSGSGSEEEKGQHRGQAKKKSPPGWFKVGLALPGGSGDEEDEEEFAEERRAARARSQAVDAAREHLRRSSTSSYMSASINSTRPVGGRSRARRESAVHDVPDQQKLLSRLEQRFSIPSNRSGPLPTSRLGPIESAPSSRRGSESTAFSAHPSMRMPNAKSAGHLQSYLLSPSGSMTRSAASTTASAVMHAEGPTTKHRPSSPARRPRQASAGGALHSLHSSFTGSPSWATSRGSHSGASVCSTAAAVGANQPHADVERKMRHKSAAAYVEQHGKSGLGEPEEQDAAPSSTRGQPDKPFVIGDQGGPPLPGRPSVGVGGMMEAWGCDSGVASVAPSLELGISSGQPMGAKFTTVPAPAVTAHAAVHTPKGSMTRGMVDEGAEAHVLGAGSAVATVRARKGTAVSKGGGGDDHEDEGASAASMDSSPRLGHNSPKGPLFSPAPPASEPSHAPPRGGRHTMPAQWVVGASTPDSQFSPPPSVQDLRSPVTTPQLSQSQGKPTPRNSMLASRSSTSPSLHGLEGLQGSLPSSLHNLSTAYPPPKGDRPVGGARDLVGTDSSPVFVHSKQGSQDGHLKGCLVPGIEASAIALEDGPRHEGCSGCENSNSSAHGPPRLSVNSSSRASPAEMLQHAPISSGSLTGHGHGGIASPHYSPDKSGHAHSGVVMSHPQLGLRTSLLGSDRFSKQPLSDSRLSAPIPKLSVADPRESPFNRPSKIVSDDGTRRAETQQEALKPPHSIRTRPMSALKPRSSSASPHPPGSASSAGATKLAAVSMDAPKTPVPNSSGSSPHTPSSPGKQEHQVQPSPPSPTNYGPGGPIRIQSSRSMVRKSKAADEGLSGFFDLAQQQPSPKAGLAGLALGSAHRRSALQASNAPLKATPHSQLTEPMACSTDFHKGSIPGMGAARQSSKPGVRSSVDEKAKPQPPPSQTSKQRSSSEPRQRSKLRKNSTAEGSGSRSPAGGALGDTKRAPPRGKSILNIKAALGSAMASVLNPVMQTQRK